MKKQIPLIGITIIIISICLSGCNSSIQDIILDDYLYQNATKDPINFNDIKIIRNIIYMNVSYGG